MSENPLFISHHKTRFKCKTPTYTSISELCLGYAWKQTEGLFTAAFSGIKRVHLLRCIGKGKCAPVDTRGIDAQLHSCLTSTLVGGELWTSRPGRLNLGKNPVKRRLDGIQNRSGRFGQQKNFFPFRVSNPTLTILFFFFATVNRKFSAETLPLFSPRFIRIYMNYYKIKLL
jgi:hypothetical protein